MDGQREVIVQKISNTIAQAGGGTAAASGIGGFITQNHELIWAIGVFSGVIVAFAGLIISFHFKRKSDRREQELHELQVKDIMLRSGKE